MFQKIMDKLVNRNSFYKVYILIFSIIIFGFSFVPFFLKQKGVSLSSIITLYAAYSLICIIFLFFLNKFRIRQFLILGIVFQVLMLLTFAFYNKFSYFIYIALSGVYQVLFWTTFNYLFFKNKDNKSNATESSIYFFIPGLLGVIIPPITALIITYFNYSAVFFISAIIYLLIIPLIYVWVKEEEFEVKTLVCVKKFKGLKAITAVEGALQFFVGIIIPVFMLRFINSEFSYGFFLTFIGVIGLVISVFLAKKSDLKKERKSYLYFLLILLTFSILSFSFITDPFHLFLAICIFTVILTLSSPLRLAISMDNKDNDLCFWKNRELFLCIGRVPTLLISSVLFFYELYYAVFIMYALIIISYILLIKVKIKNVVS